MKEKNPAYGVIIIKVGLRLIFSLEGKYFDHTTSITIAEDCHKSDTKRRCSKLELEASVCGVISHTDAEDLTRIFEHTIALSAKKEDESVSVNYEITSLKNPIEPREVNRKVSEIRSAICQLFEVLSRQPGLGYFKF